MINPRIVVIHPSKHLTIISITGASFTWSIQPFKRKQLEQLCYQCEHWTWSWERCEELRKKMIDNEGKSYKTTSKKLHALVSTAANIIRKCKIHGSVGTLPGCGRKWKCNPIVLVDDKEWRELFKLIPTPRVTFWVTMKSQQSSSVNRTTQTRLTSISLKVSEKMFVANYKRLPTNWSTPENTDNALKTSNRVNNTCF